jgi:hypothetical protein
MIMMIIMEHECKAGTVWGGSVGEGRSKGKEKNT